MNHRMLRRALVLATGLFALPFGCGGDSKPPIPSLLPADYLSSYVQVRPCRPSSDHNLNNVRVLADPAAAGPYMNRKDPFPVGAVVVKEEYDLNDTTCSGKIVQWSLMSRLATGSSPATVDWRWQQINADRTVATQDSIRCYNCHADCGMPPGGYSGTCSAP